MAGEKEGKTSATSPLPPCGEVDVSVASHSRNSRRTSYPHNKWCQNPRRPI
ncbi:unnamed protein product [Musa acuminata subsp. malaccensis]|uniref:(wild Malaysian banana) hypothetical protein n=1 Tax=Musa acuminata subsp. malaccensis TaxID=214687 RepID=A0A804J223_MUSAM|nr:unnamed protein product [Musa acuminata subsp. malaccensis]